MFTGLINGLGEITRVDAKGRETRFHIRPLFSLSKVAKGESIAVNGVCLTVEIFSEDARHLCLSFQVYASEETLSRTTLKRLRLGDKVNLERAVAAGQPLGGHLVAGHVDGIAAVTDIKEIGESWKVRVSFDTALSGQVIPKGSVTLDGISLTVNECGAGWLAVNIIPATRAETTVHTWRPDQKINLETDMIGKYVQHLLQPYLPASHAITVEFLRENGF